MKLRMDHNLMAEEFFDGTRLMGIVAPLRMYLFCWALNQELKSDFRINHDLEIQLEKKSRNYFFPVYEFQESNRFLVHYLYANQFDGEYLLPEFRHLDYLWLLKGDLVSDQELSLLLQSVREVDGVQLVTELHTDKIKHKSHLIF